MPIRLQQHTTFLRKFIVATGLWLIVCILTTATVSAAELCAVADPRTVPQTQLPAVVAELQAELPHCQKEATWLAALGHLLMRLGKYSEAAEHLERALMLDPNLQMAQLDYAVALAGMGDMVSASAAVQTLLAEPGLPSELQRVLQRQLTAWAPKTLDLAAWQMAGMVGVRLGLDSNLLAAPDLTSLTLTFPGQSQDLPLDDNYRPKSGGYQQADAQLQLRKTTGSAVWDLGASLRNRSSNAVENVGLSQADFTLERSTYRASGTPKGTSGYYTNASAFVLDAQSGTRFEALGVAAGWGKEWLDTNAQAQPACITRLGLELQERRYTSNALLSGLYTGLTGMWSCNHTSGAQWQLGFKAGHDVGNQTERAGGDQAQASVKFVGIWPVSKLYASSKSHFMADLELARSDDSAPYSALLDNGSLRKLQRHSARVEWQLPVAKATQLALGADWVNQQSSLVLFSVQNRSLYTAVRYSW